MAKIPKYVEKLLERRERLALELMGVSTELDKYCKRIGIPECDEGACLCSDVRIYIQPWNAKKVTREAIEKQLRENEGGKENGKKGANVKGEEGKTP